MSVWYAIPSARPPEEAEPVLRQWAERGYRIALFKDPGSNFGDMPFTHSVVQHYPGYSQAVNWLVRDILEMDPQAEWIVTGGDDVYPDQHHSAEEIWRECLEYFAARCTNGTNAPGPTFGVMQPTGDYKRWPNSDIRKICGSPWIGREFCRRINQGRGPMWPQYWHMFNDEELQAVAIKYGCFWQREDLTHHHEHWQRAQSRGERVVEPPHLKIANSQENWRKMREIFMQRQSQGFPGSEPL